MVHLSARGRAYVFVTLASAVVASLGACGDDSSGTGGGGGGTSSSASSASGPSQASSGTATSTGPGGTGGDTGSGAGDPGSGGATGSGGETGSGGATGSGGGSGGATGSGGGGNVFPDDCASAEDCLGGECVEVGSGFMACRYPLVEAAVCISEEDECCVSEDCDALGGGVCTTLPDASQCGGAQPEAHNVCSGEGDFIDCGKGGGTCLDAGFFGYNKGQCVVRACGGDDDCADEADGRCVPANEQCCGRVVGFFCAYPSDGCRTDVDCGEGRHCEADIESGRASCADGEPLCPP